MPRGDKTAYTDKQRRKAEHVAEGYEARGVPGAEAERRAWATVNKQDGGGRESGAGRAVDRSAAARKGHETRRRNAVAQAKDAGAKTS